jgi:hypothetical protein
MEPCFAFTASTEYALRYYPSLVCGPWKQQEWFRINEARSWDPNRSPRGWTAIDAIRARRQEDTSVEFDSFIRAQAIPEETKDNNIRRVVKNIWMWPLTDYLPWTPVDSQVAATIVHAAKVILGRCRPCLQLVEGKIYLMLTGFTSELWRQFPNLGSLIPGLARPLIANTETEHITVINSDMMPADKRDIREWLASAGQQIVSASGLKHTISLDWARFSVCLVVGLECEGLAEFVNEFNQRFGTKARVPCAHITVAIDSRTSCCTRYCENLCCFGFALDGSIWCASCA